MPFSWWAMHTCPWIHKHTHNTRTMDLPTEALISRIGAPLTKRLHVKWGQLPHITWAVGSGQERNKPGRNKEAGKVKETCIKFLLWAKHDAKCLPHPSHWILPSSLTIYEALLLNNRHLHFSQWENNPPATNSVLQSQLTLEVPVTGVNFRPTVWLPRLCVAPVFEHLIQGS